MLNSRVQSSLLKFNILPSLCSSLHTASTLFSAVEDGAPSTDSAKNSRSDSKQTGNRDGNTGGGQAPRKLQTREWGPKGQRRGPPNQHSPSSSPQRWQGSRGHGQARQKLPKGGNNLLQVAFDSKGTTIPKSGPGSEFRVRFLYFRVLEDSSSDSSSYFPSHPILQYLASDMINTDMLPFAKYMISPEEVRRFEDGRLSFDDRRRLLTKVRLAMLRSPEQLQRKLEADIKADADPNYRIEDCLLAKNRPLPAHLKKQSTPPEEILDQYKETLCQMLNLTEEEFETYKKEASDQFREQIMPRINAQDPRVQEKELDDMVKGIGPGHDYYDSIVSKIRTLQSNPQWPHEKKVMYARRLLKRIG